MQYYLSVIDYIIWESEWPLYPREHYLSQLRATMNSPFIKVISGLRRTGKSMIMDMFRTELMESGIPAENIFYLNLENDDEDIPHDHWMLTDLVKSKVDVGKGN